MKKELLNKPELEVVIFSSEDVIATSTEVDKEEYLTPTE